jgi:hypothetical protein
VGRRGRGAAAGPIPRGGARHRAHAQGPPRQPEVQDALLEAIVDESASIDRLILSDPRFICINRLVIQGPQIWPMIDRQTTQLRALFPDDAVEFFIGLRDPATHVPQLFKTSRFSDFARVHRKHAGPRRGLVRDAAPPDHDPSRLPRHRLVQRGHAADLGGASAGHRRRRHEVPLEGKDVVVQQIMDPAGYNRMQEYLRQKPPETEAQRRRVVAAFLGPLRARRPDRGGGEHPGWTEDFMAELSAAYDADMAVVAEIPGVTLLTP